MSRYSSKSDRAALDRKILSGVEKHITKNIVIGGKSISPKDFANAVDAAIEAQDEADDFRVKRSASVRNAAAAAATASQLLAGLKKYVLLHFGEDSEVLADFGFTAPRRAQKTVVEKYQAYEKTLATRAARHTMGSRQKSAIHGDVNASAPAAAAVVASQPQGGASAASGNGTTQSLTVNGNGSSH